MIINELLNALVQLFAFSFIPLIFWWIKHRKEKGFFMWIGLKKIRCESWKDTLFKTVAVTVGYIVVMSAVMKMLPKGVTTAGSQFSGMGWKAIVPIGIYSFIKTALAEEIFFRGFITNALKERIGFDKANIVQAFIFGLLHGVPFALVTKSVAVSVILTIIPAAFGWFEGWIDEKRCHGSISYSWLLHGIMNFIVSCLSL